MTKRILPFNNDGKITPFKNIIKNCILPSTFVDTLLAFVSKTFWQTIFLITNSIYNLFHVN